MIYFAGTSHAPQTLAAAAVARGCRVTTELSLASLIFVSEDTPTDENGKRNTSVVTDTVLGILEGTLAPVVLTSQVTPGFTRSFNTPRLIHMAETLRMEDAAERALRPEQFIVGVPNPREYILPREFMQYMYMHGGRIHIMSYEEAEFAKIAINMFLASQVDRTNMLAEAAEKIGARWKPIANVLRSDARIGPEAYLTPGRWQDSRHLLRDFVTLGEILAR